MLEFTTDYGTRVRAEHRGSGIYSVYVKQDDAFSGAYIHQAIVRVHKNLLGKERSIWRAFLILMQDEDEYWEEYLDEFGEYTHDDNED